MGINTDSIKDSDNGDFENSIQENEYNIKDIIEFLKKYLPEDDDINNEISQIKDIIELKRFLLRHRREIEENMEKVGFEQDIIANIRKNFVDNSNESFINKCLHLYEIASGPRNNISEIVTDYKNQIDTRLGNIFDNLIEKYLSKNLQKRYGNELSVFKDLLESKDYKKFLKFVASIREKIDIERLHKFIKEKGINFFFKFIDYIGNKEKAIKYIDKGILAFPNDLDDLYFLDILKEVEVSDLMSLSVDQVRLIRARLSKEQMIKIINSKKLKDLYNELIDDNEHDNFLNFYRNLDINKYGFDLLGYDKAFFGYYKTGLYKKVAEIINNTNLQNFSRSILILTNKSISLNAIFHFFDEENQKEIIDYINGNKKSFFGIELNLYDLYKRKN